MGYRDSHDRVVSMVDVYRRAEVERRLARGILDGKDEAEICELLGIPVADGRQIVSRLAARVQEEAVEIARIQAVKQTGMLMTLYLDAQSQWDWTHDPRYAEQMRGALADIRKIWGVDAPQRIQLGGSLNVNRGVLGGILSELEDWQLDLLESCFGVGESGSGENGEGLPMLEGRREADGPVPVG